MRSRRLRAQEDKEVEVEKFWRRDETKHDQNSFSTNVLFFLR
jgi:hypothetical protein